LQAIAETVAETQNAECSSSTRCMMGTCMGSSSVDVMYHVKVTSPNPNSFSDGKQVYQI
jgi:hypothetical protein